MMAPSKKLSRSGNPQALLKELERLYKQGIELEDKLQQLVQRKKLAKKRI